jgi:hypothetical protein
MLSSNEVGMMFAGQNEAFSGQMRIAQQVGISNPSTSLASWGSPRNAPQQQQIPGMRSPHAPFSYANEGMSSSGYGGGNRFGAGVISGAGAIGSLAMSAPFNPITAFSAGRAGATALGAGGALGVGAGLAAGAGVMAAGYAATLPMQWGVQGAQQQSMVNTMMGQNFNFFNPQSRSGSGFNRQDTQAIGNQMRGMQHDTELMTSVDELARIVPKLKQSGLFTSTRDVQDFGAKFKDAVKTLRDMSKMLGTSMEEAAGLFAHSRSQGFLGKTDQMQNMMNMQFTSGTTGMSMGQVAGLQASGGQIARAFGGSTKAGASAILSQAQDIERGARGGKFRDDLLIDMTGMEGPQAYGAAAQQATQEAMRLMSGTAMGRAMMAATAKFDEKGSFVGVDQEKMKAIRAGSFGVDELKQMAQQNLNTNTKKASWMNNQGRMASMMVKEGGLSGFAQMFTNAIGARYGGDEEMIKRGLQLQGVDENMTEMMMSMRGGLWDQDNEKQAMTRLKSREARIREKSPEAIWERTKKKIHNKFVAGFEQAGADAITSISTAWEKAMDDLVDRHMVTLSKGGARDFAMAMGGFDKTGMADMSRTAKGLSRNMRTTADLQLGMDAEKSSGMQSFMGGAGGFAAGLLATAAMGPLSMVGAAIGGYKGYQAAQGGSNSALGEAWDKFHTGGTGRSADNALMKLARDWGETDLSKVRERASRLDKGFGSSKSSTRAAAGWLRFKEGASGDISYADAAKESATEDTRRAFNEQVLRELYGTQEDLGGFVQRGNIQAATGNVEDFMNLKDANGNYRSASAVRDAWQEKISEVEKRLESAKGTPYEKGLQDEKRRLETARDGAVRAAELKSSNKDFKIDSDSVVAAMQIGAKNAAEVKLGDIAGAKGIMGMSSTAVAKMQENARDTLDEVLSRAGIGKDVSQFIKQDEKARNFAMGLSSVDPDTMAEIRTAMETDPDRAIKLLKSKGIEIGSAEELEKYRDIIKGIGDTSADRSGIGTAIKGLTDSIRAGDVHLIGERMKETGGDMATRAAKARMAGSVDDQTAGLVESLGKSMKSFGSGEGDFESAQSDMEALSKAYLGADEKTREKIRALAGEGIGGGLRESVRQSNNLKNLGKGATSAEIAKAMGIKEGDEGYEKFTKDFSDTLAKHGGLTDEAKKDIAGRMGSLGMASAVATEKDTIGEGDRKIVDTLKELNVTMNKVGTVLAKANDDKTQFEVPKAEQAGDPPKKKNP